MPAIATRKKTTPIGFGERLQVSRTLAGLTITDVARELKASRTKVRQWEQAKTPNVGTRKGVQLAKLLGVPFGWLFVGESSLELIAVSSSLEAAQENVTKLIRRDRQVGRKITR